MAYFGTTLLGVSFFEGFTFVSGELNRFTIKGGDSYIDNVQLFSEPQSDEYIDSAQLGETLLWTPNTLALMTFDGNLSAGNITNITSPITNWQIYRRKNTESTLTLLDTIPVTQTTYVDITAQPNTSYLYTILAVNDTEISTPIEGSITTDFYGMFLINPNTLTAYLFDSNLEFGGMTVESSHERYDGYNEFSAHSFGNRNFRVGAVSAIVRENFCDNTNTITQTAEFVKLIQDEINNGEEKILKTRKGEVMKVITTNPSTSPLNVNITQQPYSISFEFQEVGENG